MSEREYAAHAGLSRGAIQNAKYALREGSGGAGRHRCSFGVGYRIRLLRGEGKASFLMHFGRFGPPGSSVIAI